MNTLSAILHNMIAWQISQLDNRWTFHDKGDPTPDLTTPLGVGIQVKVTSNKHIKGNKVSAVEFRASGEAIKDFQECRLKNACFFIE